RPVRAGHRPPVLPMPSVRVRGEGWGQANRGPGHETSPTTSPVHRPSGVPQGPGRFSRAGRPGVLERTVIVRRMTRWLDDRLRASSFARTALDKVFPDHWSFMLGEVALYCFVILVLTGIYLTFFFVPSSR